MFIGLDFGTTNSALALASSEGPASLVAVRNGETEHSTFRSILYFEDGERDGSGRSLALAGPAAIEAYLQPGAEGRLIQSIKSYLANAEFSSTSIYGSRFTLEDLVGLVVSRMIHAAPFTEDQIVELKQAPIVVGRPARFVRGASAAAGAEADTFAVARLTNALKGAGLADIHFEFEPVAAAYAYEATLDRDELVLIADFGGGTSDFCLLHVGPGMRHLKDRSETIIAVSGVGIAGDAFDARLVENCIAPNLGRGTTYKSTGGKILPMPAWIYDSLKRWHQLSFINTYKTRRMLAEIAPVSQKPQAIEALTHLIVANQGFEMYRAVEAVKRQLSEHSDARLTFHAEPIHIEMDVTRADFESWIAPELAEIGNCVDRLMAASAIPVSQVDRVFLTGGSSFIPSVRALFAERFGAAKLAGGGELTSVATGLALAARQRFAS